MEFKKDEEPWLSDTAIRTNGSEEPGTNPYVRKKTAMYGSSTYGPYGSYKEALDASKELENKTSSESFFSVERFEEENKPRYQVWIDDNFHFMDEDRRVFHGEFETPT